MDGITDEKIKAEADQRANASEKVKNCFDHFKEAPQKEARTIILKRNQYIVRNKKIFPDFKKSLAWRRKKMIQEDLSQTSGPSETKG